MEKIDMIVYVAYGMGGALVMIGLLSLFDCVKEKYNER